MGQLLSAHVTSCVLATSFLDWHLETKLGCDAAGDHACIAFQINLLCQEDHRCPCGLPAQLW